MSDLAPSFEPIEFARCASEVLRDHLPTLLIDSREQTPLVFEHLPSRRTDDGDGLTSGDYTLVGWEDEFAIERKSIPDLIACCTGSNRDRFKRELHRLRGFRFARVVICGPRSAIERKAVDPKAYKSQLPPRQVLASIESMEVRYNIPFVFCDSPQAAARQVETWAWWFARHKLGGISDLARELKARQAPGAAA